MSFITFVDKEIAMKLLQPHQTLAFCHAPVCAMRKETTDQSEMISQLTFGETVSVLGQESHWIHVQSFTDGYVGFVDRRHLLGLTQKEIQKWHDERVVSTAFLSKLSTPWGIENIPSGSYITDSQEFAIGSHSFQQSSIFPNKQGLELAYELVNVPYLWGGKTSFGMDCSGLTQLFYHSLGYKLPRDSADQMDAGTNISWEDRREGDLVFFQNALGKIIHVGIFLMDDKILHASGRVRIDALVEKNIWNEELSEITHTFHSVQRYLTF